MGGVVKKVTKPFKKVARGVKKAVGGAFKAVKKVASKAWKGVRTGVKSTGEKVGLVPEAPDMPDPKDPAPPAPEPEQYAEDMTRPENIGRRKRNRRNGLRIDLNTGGAPSGNGVNVPVG
jgi:hypothetical protein